METKKKSSSFWELQRSLSTIDNLESSNVTKMLIDYIEKERSPTSIFDICGELNYLFSLRPRSQNKILNIIQNMVRHDKSRFSFFSRIMKETVNETQNSWLANMLTNNGIINMAKNGTFTIHLNSSNMMGFPKGSLQESIMLDNTDALRNVLLDPHYIPEALPWSYDACGPSPRCLYPIGYAAFFGAVKTFKFLMLNGHSIRAAMEDAYNACNLEIIHIFEQQKYQPNLQCLYNAVRSHHFDVVNWLVDIHHLSIQESWILPCRLTPLIKEEPSHSMAIQKRLCCLKDFDVELPDTTLIRIGKVPRELSNKTFSEACSMNRPEVASIIAEHIEYINFESLLASAELGIFEIFQEILPRAPSSIIDPEIPPDIDNGGWTLLHAAAAGGNLQIVDYIIQNFIYDLNAETIRKVTPLYAALLNGNDDIALYLLQAGASVMIKPDIPIVLTDKEIGILREHRDPNVADPDNNCRIC